MWHEYHNNSKVISKKQSWGALVHVILLFLSPQELALPQRSGIQYAITMLATNAAVQQLSKMHTIAHISKTLCIYFEVRMYQADGRMRPVERLSSIPLDSTHSVWWRWGPHHTTPHHTTTPRWCRPKQPGPMRYKSNGAVETHSQCVQCRQLRKAPGRQSRQRVQSNAPGQSERNNDNAGKVTARQGGVLYQAPGQLNIASHEWHRIPFSVCFIVVALLIHQPT